MDASLAEDDFRSDNRRSRAVTRVRPPRVLHAPLNLANDPWSLTRGLREIGVEADLVTVQTNPFVTPGDYDFSSRSRGAIARAASKLAFVLRAMQRYDVFHYSFGRSILEYELPGAGLLDLRLAHALGKPLVMTFHGCEVRGLSTRSCSLCARDCEMQRKARRLNLAAKHVSHRFVTTPDLLRDVPGATWIPQAVDEVRSLAEIGVRHHGPLIIVHAPSARAAKGTDAVIGAVAELQRRGWPVELRLIEGMSRQEALKAYREADLGVDQLLSGWYGVFAVEMMAMGKPVVCYMADSVLRAAGLGSVPLISASPASLPDVLEGCVANRERLAEIGTAGRKYVLGMHDPVSIARRYVDAYAALTREKEYLLWPEGWSHRAG